MGRRIDARLRKFAAKNSIDFIGDVRALGCMNCIEIVTDKTSKNPDGDLCARIIELALSEGSENKIRVFHPKIKPIRKIPR